MKRWEKNEIDSDAVKALASRFGIDLLSASILTRRGIGEPEELCFYLEDDIRFLHNPFLFDEMEDAVDRIRAARTEGENVLVFGDRDADGITSIVQMVEGLRQFGLEVSYDLPRGDDPYGLTRKAVDLFAENNGTLIITVDCGISNADEITYAAERGIDTIVVDHHNPQGELPAAYAIIDPKVEDAGYPFRDLAGCGVVAKLLWALRFSETPFYNQTVCLLNVRPGNETLILEAVKLLNLVEVDRITENLVPGMVDPSGTRIFRFLEGQQLFVFEAEPQHRMLTRIFGESADIHLFDLAPEIRGLIGGLEGKSLLRIRDLSKTARYLPHAPGELDVFASLFISYVMKREPGLSAVDNLDLVALGTLADLMPLRGENRILVKKGMSVLNATGRKGLQELLDRLNLWGKDISTTDVAWQLTPVINASGRMGVPEKAVELLLCEEPATRKTLAAYLHDLNAERKRLGDSAWERVLPLAKESFQATGSRMVMVSDESIHRGITGIIAARLVNYFRVPAAVIAFLPETAVGSLRSTRGFDVKGLLEHCSDLFDDYGGHDFAAGFNMARSRFSDFESRLRQYAGSIVLGDDDEEVLQIDAELPVTHMNPDLLTKILAFFEPYGEENRQLLFLTRRLRIEALDLMGKREQVHVKLLLNAGQYKFPAVFWNAAERVNRDFSLHDTVDIVYHVRRNTFQNMSQLQLTLLDIRRCP